MSAILGNTKFQMDENKTEKYNAKKIGGEGIKSDLPRRAALGDIQNRAIPRGGIGKDGAKDLKDGKLSSTRDVKPRVDSHWKKSSNSEINVASAATRGTRATTKTLRSTTAALAVGGIQRQVITVISNNQSKEIKTLTTKLVENKLQQAKIVNKDKILPGESKLKREDSNLSRKSLSKLKAALARDVKAVPKTQSSEAVSKLQQTLKSNVAKEATQPKEIQKAVEKISKIENVTCQTEATGLRIVNVNSHSTALIEGVRNIDVGDETSLALVSEYVNDIYEYLFQLELAQPVVKKHLSNQIDVTPKMRAVLLDWINEVHLQFHLVTETFHMTVGIIDRYLQLVNDTKRSQLQLVGITALFIASKYEELYPPAIGDFIYMTDHSYNLKQIMEMEMQIFRALDCNLSRPISIHFLRRFSKATDIMDEQHCMSKYFLELAAIEYELSSYRPSEIAAASLFLSLHMSKENPKKATGFNDKHWDATLEYYSHYTAKQLRPISRKIAKLARNAREAKLQAVFTKYQSMKLHRASMRVELYSPLMDSIINSEG